jgi:hypothetical protein
MIQEMREYGKKLGKRIARGISFPGKELPGELVPGKLVPGNQIPGDFDPREFIPEVGNFSPELEALKRRKTLEERVQRRLEEFAKTRKPRTIRVSLSEKFPLNEALYQMEVYDNQLLWKAFKLFPDRPLYRDVTLPTRLIEACDQLNEVLGYTMNLYVRLKRNHLVVEYFVTK